MMSSGQKGTHASGVFNWKLHGESSLTTRLLNGVPPEIELSDYQRLPSSGGESPSGLLREGLKVEPIADLDLFFERLYNYYCEKGLWCIIIKWVVELLSLGFTICFSGFFLLFVDWNGLRKVKCGIDAFGSGKNCDLAKEALHSHPLTPFTLSKGIIVGYLGIFSVYWIFCFLRFFAQLKDILEIRHFYYNSLQVTDREVQTTSWASILEKVVQIQRSQKLCVVKNLSEHDVVMRIMRKENYLIGMLNKGVLAFSISRWVPGAGPAVNSGKDGKKNYLILTKTLEWTLNWCILQSMFDRNFCVRRDFILNPSSLKKRLMAVGLGMLLLSPFLVIFMLVYHFLRHAEQFYNHPSTASLRRWSTLSKWIFREFNEVDHLFRHRINNSVVHAADYLKQFPSPIVSTIAKFISFVSGGFAAILIIIAFLEESLLEGQIYGRNLFWYAAVFGTVTAISRAAVTDELQVLDPQGSMSLVVQHTHYMPKKWRGKENTDVVWMEFVTLFQYTGMMLLEEMASIFLTPYLLLFVVPKRVDDILQFISDFTVDVEGVGHVCSLSVFDFEAHGNSNYGSPYNASCSRRSSQGKMEKSFLSFQSSYPTWEPNAQGKQFLSILRNFREKKWQGQGNQQAYSPPRTWQRGEGDMHSFLSRDVYINNNGGHPRTGYQFGSLWVVGAEQRNHPYLLDWYYTSRRPQIASNPNHAPNLHREVAGETAREMRTTFMNHDARYEPRFDGNWGYPPEDRIQSHLGASTSSHFFRESVLQHNDSGYVKHSTDTHWWARSGRHSVGPETSFLEPPNFHHHTSDDPYVNFSDKSSEQEQEQEQEHEQHLDWIQSHTLSKTACMDDYEIDGDFNLPFNVYNKPLGNPTM
ncbi:autophagy-related protein 9-like [Macadamia integrifolia]|uniref:autophagy-related protein 9-like n=1 Tax=Macadamia integrifolia TaxID=60698 RepID=UPI001C4F4758|nr:autophagy-related protein 9-like [Macadamia integrifolia]XP_042501755.1 autophagy-related protein 9-like [Macadamia integrifolia]XP_042501756.1 autophagy-related protein 9-like [Macadamia integrifolia]